MRAVGVRLCVGVEIQKIKHKVIGRIYIMYVGTITGAGPKYVPEEGNMETEAMKLLREVRSILDELEAIRDKIDAYFENRQSRLIEILRKDG